MKKIVFIILSLGVAAGAFFIAQSAQAKMPPAFIKLKVFGKIFNCNANPRGQGETYTQYSCSLLSNDPDLTSISIPQFWVSEYDDTFKPKELLDEIFKDAFKKKDNPAVFHCPNPNIAVGHGHDKNSQTVLRITPNTVLILRNMNPKNNWLDDAHLTWLCQ